MGGDIFILFLLTTFLNIVSAIDPLVETKLGLIRGLHADDSDHVMFLGIPYANVNRSNPFGAATPYPPFEETFNAIDDTAACPQYDNKVNKILGSLDCLRINIHVPNAASSQNRLPVMVWIHGGTFKNGAAGRQLFNPKWIVRHDVIFVSINYRLNVYGFLCLNTPEVPGNQGLKDQLMALRWVKEHIESFGGDSNKITIFGESAGAKSVDLQFIANKEKLFRGVIMNSGNSLGPELGSDHNVNAPFELAELLGFTTNDLSQALSFITDADPLAVVVATLEMPNFYPCVETEIEGQEAFLLKHPLNMDIPKAKDTAILIGFNKDECITCNANPDYFNNFDFEMFLKQAFRFDEEELSKMTDLMTMFYIGDEAPAFGGEIQMKLAEFEGDYKYIWPTERSIDKYLANSAEKVYYFRFSFEGGRNFGKNLLNITLPGTGHGDDIGYLFDQHDYIMDVADPPEPEDQLMIDRMTTMWTNFVKYGDPTPEVTELLPVKWEPVTDKSKHVYIEIDKDMSIGMRPFSQRMSFWDLFYRRNWESLVGYGED